MAVAVLLGAAVPGQEESDTTYLYEMGDDKDCIRKFCGLHMYGKKTQAIRDVDSFLPG